MSIALDSADAYANQYSTTTRIQRGAESGAFPGGGHRQCHGTVVKTEQIYSSDGTSFATEAFSIPRTEADQSFTVTLQANEGTYNEPNWVDLSYDEGLTQTLSVPP